MFVADSPAASSPSSPCSAGRKSPVDSPRRYRIGSTSATFGERRMYGGRISLVKRWRSPSSSRRRSFTRGAWISIVPAPSVTFRARDRRSAPPARARPVSLAGVPLEVLRHLGLERLTSIRRAPSRASSSRPATSSSFPSVFSTNLSMGGVSLPPGANRESVFWITRKGTPPFHGRRSTTSGYSSHRLRGDGGREADG